MKFCYITTIFLLFLISCNTPTKIFKENVSESSQKLPKFSEEDYLKGTLTKYRTCYDVHFYELSAEINIDKKFIKGQVIMHLKAIADIDTFQVDLYKNMDISSIQSMGQSLEYFRKYDAVFVTLPKTLSKGEFAQIEISYSGQPTIAKIPPWDGGFVWEKDIDENSWVGVVCEGDGASLWWPLKDHISDEPDSMQMNFTVPEGLMCVSNGVLIDRKKVGVNETFSWKTRYPINSYNATLYIGNFEHFSILYDKGKFQFPLDFFVLPHNLEKAKVRFEEVADVISFYEKTYGDYPWYNENFKLIESPYTGMEHQSAIAYGDDYSEDELNSYFGYDYILVHEAAHEWWGNSVTAPDFAEIWLHEGFATYSEALYREHVAGYDKYLDVINLYATTILNERPIIGPYGVSFFDYEDSDVYTKGALMLHTLRVLVNNDDLFFKMIKDFYQQNAYSIASTIQFIQLVKDYTGLDYQWFFDQYLYNNLVPVLEYNKLIDLDLGKKILKYRWKDVNQDFVLPITIEIDGKEIFINPTNETQVLEIDNYKIDLNPKFSYYKSVNNSKL